MMARIPKWRIRQLRQKEYAEVLAAYQRPPQPGDDNLPWEDAVLDQLEPWHADDDDVTRTLAMRYGVITMLLVGNDVYSNEKYMGTVYTMDDLRTLVQTNTDDDDEIHPSLRKG